MPTAAPGAAARISATMRATTASRPSTVSAPGRRFVAADRSCPSRQPWAAWSSTTWKPASTASAADARKPSTIAASSASLSARARVGSRGERTAEGATGWYHCSAPVVSRPRWTSWQAAIAPSLRIASARAAIPARASGRHASVVIRRRQVDSGAVTVPPTVSIAAPPAARRRQYSASAGRARPSSSSPRPCAVPTSRLRRRRPPRANGAAARGVPALIARGSDLRAAPADGIEVAGRVDLRLAPQQVERQPADPPAAGLAPQLGVVAADEQLRALRILGEHLVRGVVDERLRVVAVDLDVVDAQQVVLPDDAGDGVGDPAGDCVAAGDRLGVAVLGDEVVGQDGAQAVDVEAVDRRGVAVQRVGDVGAVLQRADRRIGDGRGRGVAHHATFIQTLLVCVSSSSDASPRLRPWPDCFTPPYGTDGYTIWYVLTQTVPARSARLARCASDTSLVQTPAARPNSVSLAIR